LKTSWKHNRQDELVAATYERLRPALVGYVMKRIGRERQEDAEDLVQDVFLQLLSYDTFLEGERLVNLVYRMARNLVVDYLRRHACSEAARAYFQAFAPRETCCTDEQVACDEMESIAAKVLSRMPSRKAEVFVLYVYRGMPVRQISETLGISGRTVENHVFRARAEIRRNLYQVG